MGHDFEFLPWASDRQKDGFFLFQPKGTKLDGNADVAQLLMRSEMRRGLAERLDKKTNGAKLATLYGDNHCPGLADDGA